MHGAPGLPADFSHLPYVNPDAPKGGRIVLGQHGTFDSLTPFIIRGVSLLGVASAGTARDVREAVWQYLASDWKPRHLDRSCTREVGLDGLPGVFASMLAGGSLGRTLVRL